MSDTLCAIGTVATTFGVSAEMSGDIRMSIVVSVISALIYAAINIATKLLTSYLFKKGKITRDQKETIDDTADDLADDGKINNSNKKD